jgi:GntR family transcriptional regulator/MocR family aminotransferase
MISSGAYERHLRTMRSRYRRRRQALVQAIAELLPGCTVSGMAAGLHLMLRLPAGVDPAVVVRRARAAGVGVVALSRYRLRPASEPALVLGYGNLRDGRERQAITLLAQAVRGD